MPLKAVSKDIKTASGLKHFTWDDIVSFSEEDRWMISYQQGGSGDWKANEKPSDGYLLVDIEGTPYWSDAIGQMPFAVDYYTDLLEKVGSHDIAGINTIATAKKYGDGKLIGTVADNTNTYDNLMIRRAVNWAKKRYKVKEAPWYTLKNYRIKKTNYSPKELSKSSDEK